MFGVDVGGTFTDVVAVRDGRIEVTKVPSSRTAPASPVVEGARRLGVAGSRMFNHASTMGLNAVLERKLPKVAFLTTDGFRDIIDRGTVHRPLDAQTDPAWRRTFGDACRPLVPRYLRRGVVERMSASGEVLIPLDEDQAIVQLEVLRRCEVRGVAICLLHAYADPRHEVRLRELVQEILGPDVAVSISSETSPLAKEYARASTTVVDVLMKLLFGSYAGELHRDLAALGFDGDLRFADCTAALLPADAAMRAPFRIVFAGPAAGTVSGVRLGAELGRDNLICADVGGTSTDVSLVVGGRPFVQNTFELEHDLVINALSTEVASVGAGGGSLVTVSASGGIRVGPGSAGADPGPACYGRGGTAPAVTDACLLMGVLRGDGFAGGEIELDVDAARRAFEALDTPVAFDDRVRSAFQLAVAHMAEEIRGVAVRHGVDPRDFSLVAYGAAGPMLLPVVLDLVPLREVIVPPHPGLFSALGLLSTDLVHHESRSAYLPFIPENAERIEEVFAGMERDLRAQVGAGADGLRVQRSFDGRLLGQSWETPFIEMSDGPVTPESIGELVRGFHDGASRITAGPVTTAPAPSASRRYSPAGCGCGEHGAMRYACDVAAERMSAGLAAYPDGDWSAYELVDCDGVDDTEQYEIHVTLRKRGGRVEVDLSGTSRQARSSINATALDVKTTVGIALKFLFDPHGRFCSGMYRDVDIVVPDGTIVSALPPDGVVFMYFEQNQSLLSALLRALSRAVGEAAMAGDRGSTDLHTAFGVDADGRPWVSAMQCGGEIGPLGANRFGDADTQCMTYQANGIAPEIEAIEAASPVVVLRHEPVPDTAGAGYHRGGAAMLRDSVWLTAAMHNVNQMRYKRVPGFGVCGGRDGTTGGVWTFPSSDEPLPRPATDAASYRDATPLAGVIDEDTHLPSPDGRYHYPFAVGAHPTAPMAVLRYLTNGGGGWGDPLEREPEHVRIDVRDGYVSIAGAARDYGVVVVGDPDRDPEGLVVDEEATARLRAVRIGEA